MKTYIYYHPFDKTMNSDDLVLKAFFQYQKEIGKGEVGVPPQLGRRGEHGKPYFINYPEVYFNVSHSGDYWSCIFGPVENGLDLQKIEDKNRMPMAKRFFHSLEQQYLSDCLEKDAEKGQKEFYRLWAYNESYVKYIGDGLTKGLSHFSVVDEEGNFGVPGVCQVEIPFPVEGYWLITTTNGVVPQVEIQSNYLQYS